MTKPKPGRRQRYYYLLYNEDGLAWDNDVDVLLGFLSQASRDKFLDGCAVNQASIAPYTSIRYKYDIDNPIATSGHFIFNPNLGSR